MFGAMKRAVAFVAGNMSYAVNPTPIRGEDWTTRASPNLLPFYTNNFVGPATSAGDYIRSSPFVYNAVQPTVIADPRGAATSVSSTKPAGNLIDPNYLLGALMRNFG